MDKRKKRVKVPFEQGVCEFEQITGISIEKELGRGGMGIVYEGKKDDNIFAVKQMLVSPGGDEEECKRHQARFHREGELMTRHKSITKHPNLVEIVEMGLFGRSLDKLYIVMEYVDGGSLLTYTESLPVPREKQVVGMMVDVLKGLDYIHQLDIVHRDIKPVNILVTKEGVPKIADFGLAHDGMRETHLTQTGQILGTAHYISPEQIKPDAFDEAYKTPNGLWDEYAAGVTLFTLLTFLNGKYRPQTNHSFPYHDDHQLGLLLKIESNNDGKGPNKLHLFTGLKHRKDLGKIVYRMIAHHPKNRYSSAKEAADALAEWWDTEYQSKKISQKAIPMKAAPQITDPEQNMEKKNRVAYRVSAFGVLGIGALVYALSGSKPQMVEPSEVVEPSTGHHAAEQTVSSAEPVSQPPVQESVSLERVLQEFKNRLQDGRIVQTNDVSSVGYYPCILAELAENDQSYRPVLNEYLEHALAMLQSQNHETWSAGYPLFLLSQASNDERTKQVVVSVAQALMSSRYRQVRLPNAVFNFLTDSDVGQNAIRASTDLRQSLGCYAGNRLQPSPELRQGHRDVVLRAFSSAQECGALYATPSGDFLVSRTFGINAVNPQRLRGFSSETDGRTYCSSRTVLDFLVGTLEALQSENDAFFDNEKIMLRDRVNTIAATFARQNPQLIRERMVISGPNNSPEASDLNAEAAFVYKLLGQRTPSAVYLQHVPDPFASPEILYYTIRALE